MEEGTILLEIKDHYKVKIRVKVYKTDYIKKKKEKRLKS